MKIVVNAISAQTGGIVTYTNNLIERGISQGFPLLVFVPKDFSRLQEIPEGSNIEVRRCHASGYGPIRRFLWEQLIWRSEVRRSKADILYSSANYGLLFSPIPQVLMIQGEISFDPFYRTHTLPRLSLRERISAALRRLLSTLSARHSDMVILPSRTAMENVLAHAPSLRKKTVVNRPGVGTIFGDRPHGRAWKQDGQLRLFFHSVYYPHKAPLAMVRAGELLRARGYDARVRLTFDESDFNHWDYGYRDLEALRDPGYAAFLDMGRISHGNLPPVLGAHDVFVFPSISETFGFPMVEAMAAGIPMVVADTRINREICGDSALYYEPEDPEELTERIVELDQDRDLRASFADRQRMRVQENFTWNQHFEKLIRDIRDLHAGRPPETAE